MNPYDRLETIQLQPILPHSDLARWIQEQDYFVVSYEEALADFGYQLRMGRN
jgi:hypothetical protein